MGATPEKTKEELDIESYAKDIDAVNEKHNMRIVPAARLEVEYIVKPKPVMEPV